MAKISEKYIFTSHSQYKMRHYRLSESLIKRIIRYPTRTEEGIAPNTIACMRPAQSKKYSEIWTMYVTNKKNGIKIITAWRYPGLSPQRNPIPNEILKEIQNIIAL